MTADTIWELFRRTAISSPDTTGTTVEGAGIAFHRFEDGTWTESWINDDTFGLLQQLGVVNPPGE